MTDTAQPTPAPTGLHVAIIMDGNGRWARTRGLPRTTGHQVGARTARRIVEAAPALGIRTLTLYAFSADNWQRPTREVGALMRLFRRYLLSETERCIRNGVRLTVIGRRDRLPETLRGAIEASERATRDGRTLQLRVALDYSARDAIVHAAARALAAAEHAGRRAAHGAAAHGRAPHDAPALTREEFAALLGEVQHDGEPAPDVDLLVRTGGEQRLSDFLLWECAYAELYFSPVMWPDFAPQHLAEAVSAFAARERRFGRVPDAAAG